MKNDDESSDSSRGSTPEPPTPFYPHLRITFSENVTKDGEFVHFMINVFHNSEFVHSIERIYEDFEYLEHCVTTDQPSYGLIIPPLPFPPPVDACGAEAESKKKMGKQCNKMIGDDFRKKVYELERYLQLLLCHPVLGQSPRLKSFLMNENAPPRVKLKLGLITKISNSLEARKAAHPDCEEYFQKERDWVAKCSPIYAKMDEAFSGTIYGQLRIARQLENIALTLRLTGENGETPTKRKILYLQTLFIESIELYKSLLERQSGKESIIVGSAFTLWNRYIEAKGVMLLRRTSLMIDYQSCNRALEKVKPNRKEAAEKMKLEAENLFAKTSDIAKGEIKRFHMKRSTDLLMVIEQYRLQQLASARASLLAFKSCLSSVKDV